MFSVWLSLAVLLAVVCVNGQNVTYDVPSAMAWIRAQGCRNASSNPTCPGGNGCYDDEFTARILAAGGVVNLDPNDPDSTPYHSYAAMNNVYDLTTQNGPPNGLVQFLQDLGWYTPEPPGCTPTNPDACFPQGAIIMTQNSWEQPIPFVSLGNNVCSCWSPLTTNGPHCGMPCGWFGGTALYFPPIPAINGPLFGSYTQNNQTYQDFNMWPNMMVSPETAINQAVSVLEVGWSHNDAAAVQAQLDLIWVTEQAVPIINWMPYTYKTWASPTPNNDIVKGTYDAYIDQFLSMLSSWLAGEPAKRAYLRFAPQPNGDWFPWSPQCPACKGNGQSINQTVGSYVAMWDYIVGKVRSPAYALTPDVLQITFDVNSVDALPNSYTMEQFYSPSKPADWFTVTGFNWGDTLPGNQWTSPSGIFSKMVGRVALLSSSTPIALCSASTSSPNGVWPKNDWITDLFQYTLDSGAKMLIYHNEDSSTDLAAFGGETGTGNWTSPLSGIEYRVMQAVSDAINNFSFGVKGANYSNPRLITTAQFKGL